MSLTLSIHLENNRRQRITTRVTSPVSEVLEEVCRKQNLNSDMYDLQYRNSTLSISSTLDFYHIPNNGLLTLIKLPKERELLPVQIFLQMEDGKRYSGTFAPLDTLWDIITALCPSDIVTKENPVVIYLRREILDEQLKTTTLRSLGIIGSSVLFRFFHKTAEQLSTQSVAPSTKRPKTEEESSVFKKMVKSIEDKKNKLFPNKEENDNFAAATRVDKKIEPSDETMDIDISKSAEKKEATTTVDDGQKMVEDNSAMEVDEDVQQTVTSSMETDTSVSLAESNISNISIPSFVTQNFIDNIEYIGERYALIFIPNNVGTTKFKDPSDDFYKLTIDDAKLLLRGAKETRKELEEAELSTAALREEKRLKKLEKLYNRYPRCVVRVQFPDRAVVQGVFKSTEAVRDVAEFLKNFLKRPQAEFFLYTTPPKTILDADTKLCDIGIPGVLVYFGTKDTSSSNKRSSSLHYLKDDIIKKAISPDIAQNVANFFRKRQDGDADQKVPMIVSDPNTSSTSQSRQTSNSSNSKPAANRPASGSNANIVPKWFKKIF